MSSRKWLSTALAAIGLTLVSVSSGSHLGEAAAGRDRGGLRLVDSGFVAVGAQPVALETASTARRGGSVNRPRPPGGAMLPLLALGAVWALLHLWSLLRLESHARRARPSFRWTLAPRAPPLPRPL